MTQDQPTPVELLDRALAQPPGVGEPIEFGNRPDRDRFRLKLYAAMSADARRSVKLEDPSEPGWGQHRWGAVRVELLGDTALWIGRESEFKVGAPAPFPLEDQT